MSRALFLSVLLLTGCASLTPRERHVLEISAAIIVAGAIAAHHANHRERRDTQPVDCTQQDCR